MNENLQEIKKMFEHLLLRVNNLEQHMININVKMQGGHIQEFVNIFKKPIMVDDIGFRKTVKEAHELHEKMHNDMKNLDLSTFIGEMKFIAKRMYELEQSVLKIAKDGIDKKIRVDVLVDGYKVNEEPVEKKQKLDSNIDKVLNTLLEREALILSMRFGLKDKKKLTLDKIGKELGVTRETIRRVEAKALRKLRHPTKIHFVESCGDKDLIKAVCG